MDSKQIYDKYCSRLLKEGMIKALLCGLAIGLGVATVLTLIFWIVDFEYFWIGAIIGVALAGAATAMLYKWVFRPTSKAIAHRVDALGLEERILTMNELKDDQSYIAQRQRADAQAALASLGDTKLSMRIPLKVIITSAVVAVAYFVMLIIGILSRSGAIPKAKEIADQIADKELAYHLVSYTTYGDGYIEGDSDQVVADGESAAMITAIAEDGWYFYGWISPEDLDMLGFLQMFGMLDSVIESSDPVRTDENITGDFEICALFMEMQENNSGDGDGDGDGEPGDQDGDGSSGAGDEGEPQPGGQQGDGDQGGSPNDKAPPGDGDGAGGGDSKQDNTFLDGKTPLSDYYGEYYEQAMNMLAEGKDLPDDLRTIIEGYFGGLNP